MTLNKLRESDFEIFIIQIRFESQLGVNRLPIDTGSQRRIFIFTTLGVKKIRCLVTMGPKYYITAINEGLKAENITNVFYFTFGRFLSILINIIFIFTSTIYFIIQLVLLNNIKHYNNTQHIILDMGKIYIKTLIWEEFDIRCRIWEYFDLNNNLDIYLKFLNLRSTDIGLIWVTLKTKIVSISW